MNPHFGRRALSLGAANATDYALQFLLPVVLVRCLDTEDFGQYRLLWLAVGTVMAVVTQAMSGSLHFFLPRADAEGKRLYVNQTLLFLGAAGVVAAWAVSGANPLLPLSLHALAQHAAVPLFVLLWVFASLLDLLPTIEERVAWQARATIGLAALRSLALSLVAFLTGELAPVLWTLLAFVAFKAFLLLFYVARYHGLRPPLVRWGVLGRQVAYAAPFGATGALYGLRLQADQWVAAALFPLGLFAAFSIATVLAPLVNLFRQSVLHAFLPGMSRQHAAGDVEGMFELNRRANAMVAAAAFPLLAFAFVFAEEIVALVYTTAYLDAAPVMRVYIVGLAALVIELTSLLLLLEQGAFALRLGVAVLLASVALSWTAAQAFGLAGAAAGSVVAVYLDLAFTLRRIGLRAGMPLARLQDWRALGLALLVAALAAAFAWGVVGHYLAASGALARLAAGAAFLVAAYLAIAASSAARPAPC